jgi:hypothetical protein
MNGSAALQVFAETSEPAPSEGIALEIGAATVFAIGAMSRGLVEFWEAGRLSPEGKLLGGEAVARLFELQQAAPGGLDFASTVRIEGMKALRARHAASPDRAVDFPEVPANEIIDELLAIVDQVAVAMAN